MKVLIFAFHNANYVSGVVTHVQSLRDNLKKRGVACELWFSSGSNGFHNCLLPAHSKMGLADYPSLFKRFGKIVRTFNPDIIHMHGVIPYYSRKPIVATNHGLFTGEIFLSHKNFLKIIVYDKIIYNLFLERIIAVSSIVKEDLIKYLKLPSEKIEIIPNAIDIHEFACARSRREHILKHQHPFRILFIKPLIRKGIVNAFKAIQILAKFNYDFELLIVGSYSPQLMSKLLSYAKEKRFLERVKVLGQLPRNILINEIFPTVSVFLIPSYYEAFPIAALEAMASGIPVICGNLPSELVIHGKTGLRCNPKSPLDIAEKCIELMDGKLSRKISDAAYRHVAKNFTWENVSKKLIELYNSVM